MNIKYNADIGAFVNTANDEPVTQAELLEWAAKNPEPIKEAKKEQEYIDSGKKAEVAALQKEIDSGKYSGGSDFAQSNQAAVGGGAKGRAANTDNDRSTGTSQGYSQHYARGGLATMFRNKR